MPINLDDNSQQYSGAPRRGKILVLTLVAVILGFITWKRFLTVDEAPQRADAATPLLARTAPEIKPPPPEKPAPMPVQKPQAVSQPPRPAPPARKEKNPFQEMQEKKRLEAMWAWPTGKPGKGELNAHSSGVQSDNRQVLEVPRAGQQQPATVWNSRFDQRGTGQPGVLQYPTSPYEISPGWRIPVRLLDPINTDTEGQIAAEVIEDVYDSATGKHKLIPAGSLLVGSYDRGMKYSQERLPTAWHRLNLPNGTWMSLAAMPGANQAGEAGVNIETNNHFWGTAGRALLITLTGAAGQMASRNSYGGNSFDATDALGMEAGRELRSTGRNTFSRGMHRPPTGTAEAGAIFFVQVTAPMTFPGPYEEGNGYAFAD